MGDDGNIVNDTKDMANVMNKYFSNIGKKISQSITQLVGEKAALPPIHPKTIFLQPTDHTEIEKIIKIMKDTAGGRDTISSKVLKEISIYIAETLAFIFNVCIERAIWPEILKQAVIVPMHKGNDKHKPANYRPISLISNIAKIFEKIVYKRIYEFVQENNIIDQNQHGFVKNKGTKDALRYLTNIIYNKLDKSEPLIITFLDLAKAFDTVNHKILLDKLYNYGVRGKAHDLLKNYLTDRQQTVRLQNFMSDTREITVGVPQGTILGPLLFILYVNDLLVNMPRGATLSYADDTAIIAAGKTWSETQSETNKLLEGVNKWLVLNKLSLNLNKTVFMTFGNYYDSVPDIIEVKINDRTIKRVESNKYLGINLDYKVKWDLHIDSVIKKKKIPTICF